MSDVISRPATSSRGGRSSARGGKSGLGGRGGAKAGYKPDTISNVNEDELNLKRVEYSSQLSLLQDMFGGEGYSDADLITALDDLDGDEMIVIDKISSGSLDRWREVKDAKHKEHKSESSNARPGRGGGGGGRGRAVSEGLRGGRGKSSERGGARGGKSRAQNTATNGARFKGNQQLSVSTEESNAWGSAPAVKAESATDAWVTSTSAAAWEPSAEDGVEKPTPTPTVASKTTSAPTPKSTPAPVAEPTRKTWASMLRESTAPKPALSKPKEAAAPTPADPIEPHLSPAELEAPEPKEPKEPKEPEPESVPEPAPAEPEPEPAAQAPEPESESELLSAVIEAEIALPPSKDKLTETNLERVLDASAPPATGTAASTAADSWDPRAASLSATATPLSASQAQHQAQFRPAITSTPSGYVASALKATTERAVRTPSFTRRVLDQEEAVRMPGNREVNQAAVQFGSLALGEADDDIDGDREEAETRAQPPADSPVAHPRTSFPPAQLTPVPDTFPSQQQNTATAISAPAAPAIIPTAPPSAATVAAIAIPTAPAAHHQQASAPIPTHPAAQNSQHFNRFDSGTSHDAYQKQFSTFGQQAAAPAPTAQQSQQPPFEPYFQQQSQSQSQAQTTQPGLPPATSAAPTDYSSYATADLNRNAYNNLYGGYYQNFGQGQQESVGAQARGPFAGYNASQHDGLSSQYPQAALHNQSRFGNVASDAQGSGQSTPNPTGPNQTQPPQQPGAQLPQQGAQGSQNHPHAQQAYGFNQNYMYNHHYGTYGYPYGNYGGPYGKGYGQPYGGPSHYDASSPAPFGTSLHRNESGPGSALGDYGRAAAGGQGANPPGIGSGVGFGGAAHDSFRSSSYQSQGQGFGSSQTAPGAPGSDELKPFGDAKTAPGPSPSLGGVRPTSAANNAGQTGLPPPGNASQGQMGGFNYPSQLQQHLHSSYGGMGGSAGSNQHNNNSPYGSYGSQGYGSYGGHGGQNPGHRAGGTGWGSNYN